MFKSTSIIAAVALLASSTLAGWADPVGASTGVIGFHDGKNLDAPYTYAKICDGTENLICLSSDKAGAIKFTLDGQDMAPKTAHHTYRPIVVTLTTESGQTIGFNGSRLSLDRMSAGYQPREFSYYVPVNGLTFVNTAAGLENNTLFVNRFGAITAMTYSEAFKKHDADQGRAIFPMFFPDKQA